MLVSAVVGAEGAARRERNESGEGLGWFGRENEEETMEKCLGLEGKLKKRMKKCLGCFGKKN